MPRDDEEILKLKERIRELEEEIAKLKGRNRELEGKMRNSRRIVIVREVFRRRT